MSVLHKYGSRSQQRPSTTFYGWTTMAKKQRSITEWTEPKPQTLAPSFAEHGFTRHGVFENMVPLGVPPKAKDKEGESAIFGGGEVGSMPEVTPAPDLEPGDSESQDEDEMLIDAPILEDDKDDDYEPKTKVKKKAKASKALRSKIPPQNKTCVKNGGSKSTSISASPAVQVNGKSTAPAPRVAPKRRSDLARTRAAKKTNGNAGRLFGKRTYKLQPSTAEEEERLNETRKAMADEQPIRKLAQDPPPISDVRFDNEILETESLTESQMAAGPPVDSAAPDDSADSFPSLGPLSNNLKRTNPRAKQPEYDESTFSRGMRNNGLIDITNDPDDDTDGEGNYVFGDNESKDVNSKIFRVPEKGLILDFVSKVKSGRVGKKVEARHAADAASRRRASMQNFTAYTFPRQQAALALAQLANKTPGANLGEGKVHALILGLTSEAPPAVSSAMSNADPPPPSAHERAHLKMLQKLIQDRLALPSSFTKNGQVLYPTVH